MTATFLLRIWVVVLLCQLASAFVAIPTVVVTSRRQPCYKLLAGGGLYASRTNSTKTSDDPQQQNSKTKRRNGTPTTKRRNRTWAQNYALLQAFHKDHGHADVPTCYQKDPKLGGWLTNQRKLKATMPKEKVQKLEALNVTWEGSREKKSEQRWQEMFQCLQEYKKEWGHCRVPLIYPDNQKFGNWVYTQRRRYTLQILDPKHIQQLNSIGFVWRLKPFVNLESDSWEKKWEQKYQELLLYKKANGDCNVPTAMFGYQHTPLGNWVNAQREMNCYGRLRADRKERLDKIGFVWTFKDIFDETWQSQFDKLKQLKGQERNKINKMWSQKEQADLFFGEHRQQASYLRRTLDPEREKLLDEIGYFQSYWNTDAAKKKGKQRL